MTPATATERRSEQATDKTEIRPFQVDVPEAELTELRRRINATRLPEKETVADFSQGVPLATVQKLARYWATEYDWRKVEARLNAVPNFITEIDGLDIHFIHVRSKHENALPVIVTHGWPGSIIEQLKIIDPLTNPTAHGASASDAFHVVIPSMPGYGFSAKPTQTGWGPERMARAWDELMKRVGYSPVKAGAIESAAGVNGQEGACFGRQQVGQRQPRELAVLAVGGGADGLQHDGPPFGAGMEQQSARAQQHELKNVGNLLLQFELRGGVAVHVAQNPVMMDDLVGHDLPVVKSGVPEHEAVNHQHDSRERPIECGIGKWVQRLDPLLDCWQERVLVINPKCPKNDGHNTE